MSLLKAPNLQDSLKSDVLEMILGDLIRISLIPNEGGPFFFFMIPFPSFGVPDLFIPAGSSLLGCGAILTK